MSEFRSTVLRIADVSAADSSVTDEHEHRGCTSQQSGRADVGNRHGRALST
jgi:hypothetical protein